MTWGEQSGNLKQVCACIKWGQEEGMKVNLSKVIELRKKLLEHLKPAEIKFWAQYMIVKVANPPGS